MLAAYALFFALCAGSYLYYQMNGRSPERPSFKPESDTASSVVTGSGIVAPSENPDLAFSTGGTVAEIAVHAGDHVAAGAMLASLDTASLRAQREEAAANLKAAQASLALQYADTENTSVSVEQVTQQQNTLVANAKRTLYSEGLAAVPESSNYAVAAPTISGQYDGAEGTYKVVVRHSSQPGVDDHEVLTFGLENTPAKLILKDEATPLGTHGLFISFSGTLSDYDGTTWYVTIPNTRSSSYLANRNAYDAAVTARDKAISDAQAKQNPSLSAPSVNGAQIAAAQAAVDAARAALDAANIALSHAIITAPYSGTVSAVRVKVGDNAGANVPAISLSPDNALQVDVYLSELSIAKVAQNDAAEVTLDAFGGNTVFKASVLSIDQSPTTINGTPAYKTVIQFATSTPQIATGMSANVTIYPSHI